jgi:hypothetical protein
MALVFEGRELDKFTASIDLDLKPADPKLRQLLLDAVVRNKGRAEDVGRYELVVRDDRGRELHKYVDTKDG